MTATTRTQSISRTIAAHVDEYLLERHEMVAWMPRSSLEGR
jgi:hypothetical protein